MTRAFVVVNAMAGGHRTRRLWPGLRDQLSHLGLDFEYGVTTGPGVATDLARTAVHEGWPLVIAVGGDGTVNEVINGLTDEAGRPLGALGVIATGRGRDVCRNLGVSSDPVAAARRILYGQEILVDLNVAELERRRRYFVNAAGVGFDAEIAERTRIGRGRSAPTGTLPYLLGIVAALRTHQPRPATIEVDDQPAWSGPLTTAVVANGAYYGGGMMIAPAADPTDGYLDLTIIGDVGRAELLRWLPSVYRGRHVLNPKIVVRRGHTVTVHSATSMRVHVDGEGAGETPLTIRVCPRALRIRR